MEPNITTAMAPPQTQIWTMPSPVYISTTVILSVETVSAVFANLLLIVTICHSPSLKTPPNAQLVSICVNNLLLALSAVISLASILCSQHRALWSLLNDMQLLLSLICLLQYWCIFSAIGFYRNKILLRPSLTIKVRKRIIRWSIGVGWLTSVGMSILLTLTYRDQTASMNWNPFRRYINIQELNYISPPKAEQLILLFLVTVGFIIGICGIVVSYHKIFKTLSKARPLVKNKVVPFTPPRPSSASSVEDDLFTRRSYLPACDDPFPQRSPFTISYNNGSMVDNVVVHYQKCQEALSFEIYALENPRKFNGHPNVHQVSPAGNQLQHTLSNASNTSTRSGFMEFNDISPAGELDRIQNIKNSTALWSQSLRRDRVSLKAATTNSLVMLAAYITLSLPYVLCSLPGVVSTSSVQSLTLPLLYARLLFYLNAPAYPIWYLVFSNRVRKCLYKLFEQILIQLNLKK